jgi:ABC-type amino acid transport substrate-binding protein
MFGRASVSVRFLALVAAVSWSGCATEAGNDAGKTLEPGVLKVCLYPGFAPFVSKDEKGQWAGWDVSYLEAFAKREKLTFQPVEVANFNGIWNLPGQGECDIAASGISDTEDRRKATGDAATWSQNYYRVVRSFVVRTADEGKLNGIEDLRDKTVIVTEGSTADLDLRNRLKIAGIESVTIETTPDEEAAAIKVRDGGGVPFAYGGGLGSNELLVEKLGGLVVAWPHCNMLADGTEVNEPFSFVVSARSSGLAADLDRYIAHPDAPYEGGPGPDLKCPPAP